MKGRLVALDQINGRNAAALIYDGVLEDLLVDPATSADPVQGTIFRAHVDRPMKGQGGQIVRLSGGRNGFLRQHKGQQIEGQVLVQVTGCAEPGKAVPVSTKLLFKGANAIVTPGAPGVNLSRKLKEDDRAVYLAELVRHECPTATGVILRSSILDVEEDDLLEEINALQAKAETVMAQKDGPPTELLAGPSAHEVARSEWLAEGDLLGFVEEGVEDLIAAMDADLVQLTGGASAFIEPTRALVAVDVNTGGDTSPAAGLKANIALARDLPRQLRCRGLGGQITIDFAPFPKKERRAVEQVLRAAFKSDPIETALVGWTPLGHFELQRKRERFPLH